MNLFAAQRGRKESNVKPKHMTTPKRVSATFAQQRSQAQKLHQFSCNTFFIKGPLDPFIDPFDNFYQDRNDFSRLYKIRYRTMMTRQDDQNKKETVDLQFRHFMDEQEINDSKKGDDQNRQVVHQKR